MANSLWSGTVGTRKKIVIGSLVVCFTLMATNVFVTLGSLTNSFTTLSDNGFEQARRSSYGQLNKYVNSDRMQFDARTLDGWNRSTGGLDDSDRLLLGAVYGKSNSIFEYGLGESSRIAAHVSVPRFTGVDSDAVYVASTRDASPQHFSFSFADIGDTVLWGRPVDRALNKIPFNYVMAPLVKEAAPFDTYLVDGRFRVACVYASFLHALATGGNLDQTRVLLHDYFDDLRGAYREVEELAEAVERSSNFASLRIKEGVTDEQLLAGWRRNIECLQDPGSTDMRTHFCD